MTMISDVEGNSTFNERYSIQKDMAAVYGMVHDLEWYLNTFQVVRNELQNNLHLMSTGHMITLLNRLAALKVVMTDDERAQLGNIMMVYRIATETAGDKLHSVLQHETILRFHAIKFHLKELQSHRSAIKALQFHRTVAQESLLELRQSSVDLSQMKHHLNEIDDTLLLLLTNRTDFCWQPQLELAYPEGAFWWLYR